MLRKILTQLFIFFLLFLTYMHLQSFKTVETNGLICNPLPVFPQLQINMLKLNNEDMVNDALKETEKILLKYLRPTLQDEAWETKFVFADLLADEEPEVVVTLTLSPDTGIITILQKQNDHYILLYYLDNLLPITNLQKLKLTSGKEFLLTHECHNELTGAFCETHMLKIWGWQNNNLKAVWAENSYWEINWLNTWENPQAQPIKWHKLLQNLTVACYSASQTIEVTGKQSHYEAPGSTQVRLPKSSDFILQKERSITASYYWQDKWQSFVLATGKLKQSGTNQLEDVAILKDMENYLESMVKNKEQYQVMNKKGDIFLVNKENVLLDD